ncbi:MAG: helix-turn-helix domain-containing protein [Acetatifactor sp.]|nr:helix-turn-helix domain-containing protein [Acetatifactor sp.]
MKILLTDDRFYKEVKRVMDSASETWSKNQDDIQIYGSTNRHRYIPFVILQPEGIYRIIKIKDKSHFAGEVFKYLISYMNYYNMAYVNYDEIKDMYECNVRSISRALETLREMGAIICVKHGNECVAIVDYDICFAGNRKMVKYNLRAGQTYLSKDEIYEKL